MKPSPSPLRGILVLAAAVALTALGAHPGAAQPPQCSPNQGQQNITSGMTCKIAGDSVQFGSSGANIASGTISYGQGNINLTRGWAYLAAPGSAGNSANVMEEVFGTETKPPVKVSTTYTVASAGSAHGPLTDTTILVVGQGTGTFLVLVSVDGTNDTTVSVALVEGSMIGLDMAPGCQMTYVNPIGTMSNYSSDVQNILDGLNLPSLPTSCPSLPCPAQITGSNPPCAVGGYTATFLPGASATVNVEADSINLANGSVFLSSTPQGSSGIVVATSYMSTDSAGPTDVFKVSTGSGSDFLVTVNGAESAYVAVSSGSVTATMENDQPVTRGYQMTYTGAGLNTNARRRRTSISSAAYGILCGLGVYPAASCVCTGQPCRASNDD
ncbi:MAG TPA: hypothetical protein VF142_03165 [Longimicrobium sp.]